MTTGRQHAEPSDDEIRAALTATGDGASPEFVSSLGSTLADAAAGHASAFDAPDPLRRPPRWPLMLSAAATIAVLIGAFVFLASRDGDAGITTAPSDTATRRTTQPDDTVDPTSDDTSTAAQLTDWVGVRLHGVGNGAVGGSFAWFTISAVDADTGDISMSGNDGCNSWSAQGTIVDGRFEFVDGGSTLVGCGPGAFSVRQDDVFVVREDGIDIERDGIVYPFGPDPVVADMSTLIDGRRFIDISDDRPFPISLSFDGTNVSGFDGCGTFTAAADYQERWVRLIDVTATVAADVNVVVESRCSDELAPRGPVKFRDGDTVEHVGGNTVLVQHDGAVELGPLVAIEEHFVPPTTEWLVGEWLVGSGRVTFDGDRVVVGRCETSWISMDGFVRIDPWGDCVTGLFPGDQGAEQTLRTLMSSPLVQRLLTPTEDVENASVLDSGSGAVRLVRIEESPPASPTRLFALATLDETPFGGARLPTISTLGVPIQQVRGNDGCVEYFVEAPTTDGPLQVEAVSAPLQCPVSLTNGERFAPAVGSIISIDGAGLTATDADGRTGRYVEVTALDGALVSDLLDPTTGAVAWDVGGLFIELTGPPGVGVMRIGSCERSWSFGYDDDTSVGFGPLLIGGVPDGDPEPVADCAGPDPTHDAAGLLDLLRKTSNGDGAELRVADDGLTIYLIWVMDVIRLDP